MATESGRVVREGQEELPVSGAAAAHSHTRSHSHIQFQPLTRTSQWQATLDHTRSHSHTHHFITPSHTQQQRYSCRLTHSLSAMTKAERGGQGSAGKFTKPSEPLFPKTLQQLSSHSPDAQDFDFFHSPIKDNCSESGGTESFEVGAMAQPLLTTDPLVL
ncbi:hypothetical protein XENORESO_014094 [Xenotaenia resolanae]|uniref:Uncharacterized protein n=1 Tax=Xenotaenia resolanae TaxID=208358 RepID=A0ABV0WKX2_9TELE